MFARFATPASTYAFSIERQSDGSVRVLITYGGHLAFTKRCRTQADALMFGQQYVASADFRRAVRDENKVYS